MGIWTMAFSSCALALNTSQYYSQVLDTFSRVVLLFSITWACYLTGICSLHTLNWLIEGTLFIPRPKWGPSSFMKLTHDAFRFAIPNIARLAEATSVENPSSLMLFVKELDPLLKCFVE